MIYNRARERAAIRFIAVIIYRRRDDDHDDDLGVPLGYAYHIRGIIQSSSSLLYMV